MNVITIKLVLIIQFLILLYYLISFLNFYIKTLIDSRKLYKINLDDKDKFKYYREIIKDYSIGELGYIYNGRRKTNLLIIAELEYLKLQNEINVNKDEIKVLNDISKFRTSERYILEHYKFINDKVFKKNYISSIEKTLKEKGVLVSYKIELNSKVLISLFIMIVSFFISWFLILFAEIFDYMVIEIILFLVTGVILLISMLNFNVEKILVKTDKWNKIYMKLNGLKKYIKDFGNFDKKSLNEVALWEEYVLYAIILDESNTLEEDVKNELKELINNIYK